MAAGRFSLAQGVLAGLAALALGAWWLALTTNPLTVALALLTAFTYVAIYTPLKRVTALATFIGAFPRHGSAAWLDCCRGRIEWPAVALFAILSSGSFLTSWRLRGCIATTTPRRHLHVARRAADGWSTWRGAVFAVAMIPVSLMPWRLGMTSLTYAVLAVALGAFTWATPFASRASCAANRGREP